MHGVSALVLQHKVDHLAGSASAFSPFLRMAAALSASPVPDKHSRQPCCEACRH